MTLPRYVLIYLAILIAGLAVQISLGANMFTLLGLVAVSSMAVIPLSKRNMAPSDVIFLTMCIFYGTAAIVLKSVVLQPVDSNLIAPTLSAAYLLIGFGSITIGYLIVGRLRPRSQYFAEVALLFRDGDFLNRASKPMFLVGFALYFAHTLLRPNVEAGGFEEGGFGGFGSFYPLLLLGLVMQFALCIVKVRFTSEKLLFLGMAVLIVLLATAGNAKRTVLDLIAITAISIFAYRVKVRPRLLIGGLLLGFIVVFYFQPAIQIIRTKEGISALNRLPATWQVLVDNGFDPIQLSNKSDEVTAGYKLSYSQSYIYPVRWNVERYTMILPTDEVIRSMGSAGPMGSSGAFQDIFQILPSFLISKERYSFGDTVAWHFGFRSKGIIGRPVIGLVGSSAAMYDLLGVLILPGIVVALAFAILDFVGGNVRGSPWAVFICASNLIVAERDVTLVSFFLRDFLITLAAAALLRFWWKRQIVAQDLTTRVWRRPAVR